MVKLYVKTEAEANETAAWVRAEGLTAVIESPELIQLSSEDARFETGWAVRVEGDPDEVVALGRRVQKELFPRP